MKSVDEAMRWDRGTVGKVGLREFGVLHPKAIRDGREISVLLRTARGAAARFSRGVNRQVRAELAELVEIREDELRFRAENFARTGHRQVFLKFEVARTQYFFAADLISEEDAEELRVRMPRAIFQAERRDRGRFDGAQRPVRLRIEGTGPVMGCVLDESPGGMAVAVPDLAPAEGDVFQVEDSTGAGKRPVYGVVRGKTRYAERRGWTRLHLATFPEPPREPMPARVISDLSEVGNAAVDITAERLSKAQEIRLVACLTEEGEEIRGIVNSVGGGVGAPAVIVPPGWGRTKETLLPLALTLIESFSAAGEDLTVLRFDGIRKRGESFNDPDCRAAGREHHRFTFYQGVRDIRAIARFLRTDPRFRARTVVLVTFSASSIEGRKFLAEDGGGLVDGWVSVAGGSDLQAILRTISGGVDYIGGIEKGIRFGVQEILGVAADIDHAGRDAARHHLSYLEDAREDMRRIQVPVTWIRSRYDAWMDNDRVTDVLSCGDVSQRRLLEIPTGHQLRSSREALQTFRLVAEEVSEMLLGRRISGVSPARDLSEAVRRAEARRLSRTRPDLRAFWQDYVVGRREGLGIELMNETRQYAELMDRQIEALSLRGTERVLDLGSGTGAFPRQLAKQEGNGRQLRVIELDLVKDGLRRVRGRLVDSRGLRLALVQARVGGLGRVPFRDEAFEAVVASLVLSYVEDPRGLLREIHRVLVPGGRLVLSSMKQDADISGIFTEALAQVAIGEFDSLDQSGRRDVVLQASRDFLNDVSRLLDLEEAGVFAFWPPETLRAMIEEAGFHVDSLRESFGNPSQAYVVSGRR